MHTEFVILVSNCKSFLHKLTTSLRSEFTPLCVNQDEKFIQVKLTPLRSIFKYGYIVNLTFL